MPLFSRKTEVAEVPEKTETNNEPPAATPQIDYDTIVNRVTENLKGIVQPQQQQQQTSVDNDADDPDFADMTPEERQRAQRIAAKAARAAASDAVAPYADIFAGSIPQLARDSAVGKLSDGQQIMYKKYQKEVDDYVNFATRTNPALAGDPRIHTRAIKLMLGEHVDEIEKLVLEKMTEEDLPPRFARSSDSGGSNDPKVELSSFEQDSLEYYQTRKNNIKQQWTPESYKYYKSIKPGFMHDMVAQHKAAQKKD